MPAQLGGLLQLVLISRRLSLATYGGISISLRGLRYGGRFDSSKLNRLSCISTGGTGSAIFYSKNMESVSSSQVIDQDLDINNLDPKGTVKVDKCDASNRNSNCGTNAFNDRSKSKDEYERAVNELHNLMSNVDVVARNAKRRVEKRQEVIPNMNQFILRSGLTDKDVNELSIIHVSGTKGKGSTCAFVERILHSKGYKTALFSSPHLVEVRERFRINGRPISRDTFVKHFWKVYSKLRETDTSNEGMPAYFAFNVILGLNVFVAESVDVIIMEVGIGGQYDSTNFIRHPAVCGVTSLGYDHTSLLGNTLEEIAWNKAGIFKNGRPALTVSQSPTCMEVLLNRAKEKRSPLHRISELSQEFVERGNFHLGIAGSRQVGNASLAVQLARTWESTQHKETLACNVESISSVDDIPELKLTELTASEIKGLSSCVWPGRAQTIKRPGITYYLDGAHTKESIEVCSEWFNQTSNEEIKSLSGKVVRILMFNVTGDRNITALLSTLKCMCTFDAAVFSTNVVSTVPCYNVADQSVKNLTKSDMMRRAETNKAHWDRIVSSNDETSAGDNNNCCECTTQNSHGKSESKPGSVCPVSSTTNNEGDLTTNNEGELTAKNEGDLTANNEGDLTAKNESENNITLPAKKGRYATDTNSFHPLHSPRVQTLTAPHSKADLARNISTTSANNADSLGDAASFVSSSISSVPGLSESSQKAGGKNSADMSNETSSNNGGSSVDGLKHLSYSFPCVLHALSWATQMKDPGVVVMDTDASLPSIPDVLSEADHIQILVTGSLHLVGAVLAVLEPTMND